MGFPGGSVIKNLPANTGDAGSFPGLGRYPGGRNGNLLQYSCLGNPMDRGAYSLQFSSVQSLSRVQLLATPWTTARQPSLSITNPRVHPNPCPLSQWCHPTISSSVVPFSSCPQSFPVSGSFQMNQLFASSGRSIGVSASTSVLPMNTQDDLL